MDLFLETPQQKAERLLRQQERLFEIQQRAAQDGVSAPAPGGDTGMFDKGHGFAAASKEAPRAQDYSVQQDEYRRELDYDRERGAVVAHVGDDRPGAPRSCCDLYRKLRPHLYP